MSGENEKPLDPRIVAANARRDAARAKLASKPAPDPVREAEDEAALDEARAEYGEVGDGIASASCAAGLVIVRRPKPIERARFLKKFGTKNDASALEAQKAHVLECLVYPERDRYFEIAELYPGIPDALTIALDKLARGGALAGE